MFSLQSLCTCFLISSASGILNPPLLDTAVNPFVYLEQHTIAYENHTITTEDDYILLTVRILSTENATVSNTTKSPVIFVHGLFSNFYDFLHAGPGRSIGFELLAQGYDVWLANTRGSTYGRSHVTLNPDLDASFWNFSWHEGGIYDIPANIDYITNVTGSPTVNFVGHSQGTTMFLVMTSSKPEYNEKIEFSLLISPVAYLQNSQSPIVLLFKDNVKLLEAIVDTLHLGELFRHSEAITELTHLLCNTDVPTIIICDTLLNLLAGPSTQKNESMTSVILTNDPAGSSAKQILHYFQNAKSGQFNLYDYGTEGNDILYNQTSPPSYDLSEVTAPVALIYGASDYFVNTIDALKLAGDLPNLVLNFIIPYLGTNHFDVLSGTQAQPIVNQYAINLLNQYNN